MNSTRSTGSSASRSFCTSEGNQWEITKPYMRLYLEKFVCRVTADSGTVLLDDAFGRPMPTDAKFIGNVVIHITPTDPNDPWECFIHLDDVGFLAEKSLFSSTGAVRFLSRAVRLTGTGMELVYDAPRSRLELFRIFDLDSLRLRSSEVKAVSGKGTSDSRPRVQAEPPAGKDSGGTASADECRRTRDGPGRGVSMRLSQERQARQPRRCRSSRETCSPSTASSGLARTSEKRRPGRLPIPMAGIPLPCRRPGR